jgi:hypothetical protein
VKLLIVSLRYEFIVRSAEICIVSTTEDDVIVVTNNSDDRHRVNFTIILHWGIAFVLLLAACMKIYAMTRASWEMSLSPRLLDLALIEFELLISALLLMNTRPTLSWGLALSAFTIFTGVSAKSAAAGAKACGCFGPAAVDPRIMVVIDLAIVIALIVTGPRKPRSSASGRPRRILAAGMALMLLGIGVTIYSAIPRRGLIASENGMHDFGTLSVSAAANCQHSFALTNTTGRPLQIQSASSSCGCTIAELPRGPIDPGGSAAVKVRADWSKAEGHAVSRIVLHTDSYWTPEVILIVTAEISRTETPPATLSDKDPP